MYVDGLQVERDSRIDGYHRSDNSSRTYHHMRGQTWVLDCV